MPIRRSAAAVAITTVLGLGVALYGVRACDDSHAPAPSSNQATATARAFLSAWQTGDLTKAAQLTTRPSQAGTELRAYRDKTGITSVAFTPEPAHGTAQPFKVTAQLNYLGTRATWQYTSQLAVEDDPATGQARVAWHSSVIHPDLPDGGGYTLQPFTTTGPSVITDRKGKPLTVADHPGLQQVLTQLQRRYQDHQHEGLGIRLSSAGDSGAGRTVATLNVAGSARVQSRLDAAVQSAVEAAVKAHPGGASVVVIQPSTGDILATTTASDTEFNPALEGTQAPGQVFELVTAAALLDHNAVTPSSTVGCPVSASVSQHAFTNPDGWSDAHAAFSDVFTHACDTGFVRLADKLTGRDLAAEAREVFGLGLDWQTGVTTADGSVPELNGTDKAAAAIGRGEVRMNTLNLASLTATIQSGSFRQPLFVAPKTSGKSPARTSGTLATDTADTLRALMSAYAATAGMKGAGFGGVADQFSDSPQPVMGWFTAYRGDMAIAATAPEQTHQPGTAKAVVRAILDATG